MQAFRHATFLKRDSNSGVCCGHCELFKNSFFIENLRWLLLSIPLSQLGCFLFDFAPACAFELHEKLTQSVAQIILYYHATKKLCLAWINLSRAFDFRTYFGKTLVTFDFDEKFIQSVTQITILYQVSEEPLWLINFRAWLENGRMPCKQKYWIKNTVNSR